MMEYIFVGLVFFLLYALPGWSFSRLFRGHLRNSPFFILFLSFLVIPLIYTLQLSLNQVNFFALTFWVFIFFLACFYAANRFFEQIQINLESLLPNFKPSGLIVLLSVLFFFMVMSPRIGLWQGFFPIGDDQHQIRKIVSIAESPNVPLFYHFPTTRLTIYYFNNVAPGLWVKFTNNQIKAHQAWFIHVALQTTLLLWIIVRIGGGLFSSNLSRFVFFWALTFFSGFEFFIYKIKGLALPASLEWWTDHFLSQSQIHMQISNPFTLFFWVPQHLMAALFVLLIFLITRSALRQKIILKVLLALLWANVLGNSAFIFISTAVVYGVYELIKLVRTRDLPATVRFNLPIVILALILSSRNLELFLTAEKGHYFVPMANVFWFFSNSTLWGKIINLTLTIPLYLFVEFGVLFFVLIYSLVKFVGDRIFAKKYLFFYLFIFLLSVIFFVKSLDDNNISMRAFIPAQIGLAIFAAHFIERLPRTRILLISSFLVLLVSLPTGLYEYGQRLREQFPQSKSQIYDFYSWLDQKLPLNAVVLGPFTESDKISALGHRFTLKDPVLFSATDREHTASSQVKKYVGLDLSSEDSVAKVLNDNWDLKSQFKFYSLRPLSNYKMLTGEKLFGLGNLNIYPVSIPFQSIRPK